MKAPEVKRILDANQLAGDLIRAAYLFSVSPATIDAWLLKGTHGTNAILLRLLDTGKINIKDVEAVR